MFWFESVPPTNFQCWQNATWHPLSIVVFIKQIWLEYCGDKTWKTWMDTIKYHSQREAGWGGLGNCCQSQLSVARNSENNSHMGISHGGTNGECECVRVCVCVWLVSNKVDIQKEIKELCKPTNENCCKNFRVFFFLLLHFLKCEWKYAQKWFKFEKKRNILTS